MLAVVGFLALVCSGFNLVQYNAGNCTLKAREPKKRGHPRNIIRKRARCALFVTDKKAGGRHSQQGAFSQFKLFQCIFSPSDQA